MAERKRIGCVHEFHPNFDHKDWISDQDLKSDDPVVKKGVQHWLFGLDEPWSKTSVHYAVHPNHAPVSKIFPGEEWVAEYTSIFYDCMESVAIAYGNTPQEAIANVDNMVNALIKTYYMRDEEDDIAEEGEIEGQTDDGLMTLNAEKVLKYMYKCKKNIPQPIICDEISIIAQMLNMEVEKVKSGMRELLTIELVSCFREIESLGVAQYELNASGELYCNKRY